MVFTADFKLGHYMKIPPRVMFFAQVIATAIAGTVQLGIQSWYVAFYYWCCAFLCSCRNLQDVCSYPVCVYHFYVNVWILMHDLVHSNICDPNQKQKYGFSLFLSVLLIKESCRFTCANTQVFETASVVVRDFVCLRCYLTGPRVFIQWGIIGPAMQFSNGIYSWVAFYGRRSS